MINKIKSSNIVNLPVFFNCLYKLIEVKMKRRTLKARAKQAKDHQLCKFIDKTPLFVNILCTCVYLFAFGYRFEYNSCKSITNMSQTYT